MSAITTDIFLDALGLLAQSADSVSIDLVEQLIQVYADEKKTNTSFDDNLIQKFITTLDHLKRLPFTAAGRKERKSLLIKFLADPVVAQDTFIHNTLKDLFTDLGPDPDESYVTRVQRQMQQSILWHRCHKHVKQMWNKLNGCNSTSDIDKQELYLNDVINHARGILEITESGSRLKKGAVERIDFSNKESLQKSLTLYKEREVTNVMRTGLQGLNRMLGRRKGFALGESVCIYALLHNFKSGLLMTIARGLVCYNNPPVNMKGIPTVLFISLENEANRNMMWLYKTAYENMKMAPAGDASDAEIVEFVHEFYNRRGYKLFIERWAGNKFGYDEYVELIESYEAQGHVMVATIVDYANKMKKESRKGDNKREDLMVTELFENICTYSKTKGITFITAHQLNRDAMRLLLIEKTNSVKKFSAAFAANSIGASQEIDLELFIHLEKNHNGQKFLTMQRGKHRYVDDTPEKHQYCAYKFSPYGIGDDIEGEPQYFEDIYAVEPDGDEPLSPALSNDTDDDFE